MSTFQYVQPTDEQKVIMQNFRDKFDSLNAEIKSLATEERGNRGYSLALTKLEECAMWLNKGITNNC